MDKRHKTRKITLSEGEFCDNECIVTFPKDNDIIKKTTISFCKVTETILTSYETYPPPLKILNHNKIGWIITNNKTKIDLEQYIHASLFYPPISISQKPISNDHLIIWPSIKSLNFMKLLKIKTTTAKGHIDQERKNSSPTTIPLYILI